MYVHGANTDEPLLRLTGTTNSPAAIEAAYLQDGLGSVIGTANTAGMLTASQRFDAWGVKTASSGTVPQYGYTGREPDATGMIYYRARYYHPGIARFASRDPMGMADQISPYAYVGNDPVNYADPDGMLATLAANTVSTYWGKVNDTTVADVFPGLAPLGEGVGAGAAWLAGKATGDEGLAGAGYQGLVDHKTGIADAVIMLGTAGRGGAAKGVSVSKSRFPESAQHIEDAVAAGKPNTLTIDRANAASRRRDALSGTETRSGLDRDEFPPAMFREGGQGSSVRHINPGDNRGAGACIGAQCRGLPDGTKVRIDVVD